MFVSSLRKRPWVIEIENLVMERSTDVIFISFLTRYLNPPQNWVTCALESRELMALCLKRLKNIQRVKLIDATFVWTEPHSKRIKVNNNTTVALTGGE